MTDDELTDQEREYGELFGGVTPPAGTRRWDLPGEPEAVARRQGQRGWLLTGGALGRLFAAGTRGRWAPVAAAATISLLVGSVGAALGLHARFGGGGAGSGYGVPPARSDAALAYDAAHDVVVMFGGRAANGAALSDTWTWDGSGWTEQHPTVAPPARAHGLMAFDAARELVVLYGGERQPTPPLKFPLGGAGKVSPVPDLGRPCVQELGAAAPDGSGPTCLGGLKLAFAVLSDTWTWDGSSWQLRRPAHHPEDVAGGALAWDAGSRQVVLAAASGVLVDASSTASGGGVASAVPLPALGTAVPACAVAGSPSARAGATADCRQLSIPGQATKPEPPCAVDANASGCAPTPQCKRDTPQVDGAATPCANLLPLPQTRSSFAWNGSDWRAGPDLPAGVDVALSAEPSSGRVIAVISTYVSPVCIASGNAVPTPAGPAPQSTPPPTGGPHVEPLPTAKPGAPQPPIACHVAVASGGEAGTATATPSILVGPAPAAQVWRLEQSWVLATATPPLPLALGAVVAADTTRADVVLFDLTGHTWTWDGTRWQSRSPASSPAPRTGAAVAGDAARGQVVLFGGRAADGRVLDETWTWDGATWTRRGGSPHTSAPAASPVPPPVPPTPEPSCAAFTAVPRTLPPTTPVLAVPSPVGTATPSPVSSPRCVILN